ncbi:peptidase MA family metallohydrolase [Geobacter sp. FeAm09]|uniref:peptidase MA family metallohydrolase n=1 Tax=Geobacter sp. FeAm09 TaxID=2597769 RepID=UPI00143D3D60|nr:peptidase MA family metallohydrolase [Geobacter sp. FeAm09]
MPASRTCRHSLVHRAALLLTASCLWLSPLHAAEPVANGQPQPDDKPSPSTAPRYSEKELEQLENSHRLFPLNEKVTAALANAYAAYGHQLFTQKRYEQADAIFLKAQELYPDDATYALLRGICNYHLKRYETARAELEQARSQAGDSIEVLFFLGLVLYDTDNRQQAVELWELALKRAPGRKEILDVLNKARKETAVEAAMDQGHSSRFDLSYDPDVDTAFALAVLDVLEAAANTVNSELDHYPQARVPIGIYKRGDFKTVTDSPDWSGGVYDGKIRLPFGGAKEMNPALRAVLYHEYAHVVVFELTRGNCPLWLNEGVAEVFGRTQYDRPLTELEHAVRRGAVTDFRKLEKSFSGLSAADAALAYQQSYSMVNHLVTTYGWYRVKQILVGLGNGLNAEAAIAAALADFNLTYDGIIREWRERLAGNGGER